MLTLTQILIFSFNRCGCLYYEPTQTSLSCKIKYLTNWSLTFASKNSYSQSQSCHIVSTNDPSQNHIMVILVGVVMVCGLWDKRSPWRPFVAGDSAAALPEASLGTARVNATTLIYSPLFVLFRAFSRLFAFNHIYSSSQNWHINVAFVSLYETI